MRGEIWKVIDGYSLYEVSNMGRIKVRERKIITSGEKRTCAKTIKEKILKPHPNKNNGYLQIMLTPDDGGKRKLLYVHRLVALAFLEESECKTVTHLNMKRTDNRAINLQFGTPKRTPKTKIKRWWIVKQKLLNNACIAIYNGFDQLEKNGFHKTSILAASHNKYLSGKKLTDIYKGYRWEATKHTEKEEEQENGED